MPTKTPADVLTLVDAYAAAATRRLTTLAATATAAAQDDAWRARSGATLAGSTR